MFNVDKDVAKISFSAIPEVIPGQWGRTYVYPDEEQKDYLALYEAVYHGDISTIEKLTIKRDVGKQVMRNPSS